MMKLERAKELIAAFRQCRVLVLGDLMLDEFIWGKVNRISPEAPVPVVEVVRQSDYPGGAANVARNLCEFTSSVELLGVIGRDGAGEKLRGLLEEKQIGLSGLLVWDAVQTIVKTRIIARQQQVVRVDRENRFKLTMEIAARLLERFHALLPSLDGIIIEDYGKGFLQQSFLDEIVSAARASGKIVTGDPNVRNHLQWRGLTAVKPNRLEACHAAGIQPEDAAGIEGALRVGNALQTMWSPELLLVTLGEHGMLLLPQNGTHYHIPTRAREVFDVSGAGDTAITIFTLALCAGADPHEAAILSNHASGVVVGKLGTATITPQELLASFED